MLVVLEWRLNGHSSIAHSQRLSSSKGPLDTIVGIYIVSKWTAWSELFLGGVRSVNYCLKNI